MSQHPCARCGRAAAAREIGGQRRAFCDKSCQLALVAGRSDVIADDAQITFVLTGSASARKIVLSAATVRLSTTLGSLMQDTDIGAPIDLDVPPSLDADSVGLTFAWLQMQEIATRMYPNTFTCKLESIPYEKTTMSKWIAIAKGAFYFDIPPLLEEVYTMVHHAVAASNYSDEILVNVYAWVDMLSYDQFVHFINWQKEGLSEFIDDIVATKNEKKVRAFYAAAPGYRRQMYNAFRIAFVTNPFDEKYMHFLESILPPSPMDDFERTAPMRKLAIEYAYTVMGVAEEKLRWNYILPYISSDMARAAMSAILNDHRGTAGVQSLEFLKNVHNVRFDATEFSTIFFTLIRENIDVRATRYASSGSKMRRTHANSILTLVKFITQLSDFKPMPNYVHELFLIVKADEFGSSLAANSNVFGYITLLLSHAPAFMGERVDNLDVTAFLVQKMLEEYPKAPGRVVRDVLGEYIADIIPKNANNINDIVQSFIVGQLKGNLLSALIRARKISPKEVVYAVFYWLDASVSDYDGKIIHMAMHVFTVILASFNATLPHARMPEYLHLLFSLFTKDDASVIRQNFALFKYMWAMRTNFQAPGVEDEQQWLRQFGQALSDKKRTHRAPAEFIEWAKNPYSPPATAPLLPSAGARPSIAPAPTASRRDPSRQWPAHPAAVFRRK